MLLFLFIFFVRFYYISRSVLAIYVRSRGQLLESYIIRNTLGIADSQLKCNINGDKGWNYNELVVSELKVPACENFGQLSSFLLSKGGVYQGPTWLITRTVKAVYRNVSCRMETHLRCPPPKLACYCKQGNVQMSHPLPLTRCPSRVFLQESPDRKLAIKFHALPPG